MALRQWLLVLLAAWTAAAPDWTDCPSACRCKWTSGKKTAVCRDAGLTTIPISLNSDMQVLDVSGNSISALTRDAFKNIGLINLQRVFMRATNLQELHHDAFRDLIILVEVDLAQNQLNSLHPATFTGNSRLRVLILSGNPLGELVAEQFPPLPHLRTLELRACSLRYVHPSALLHVPQLEALDLRQNLLAALSEAVFMSIGKLNTLQLDGNPWRCDCVLRSFRTWLLLRADLRGGAGLRCAEPLALEDRTWGTIPPSGFACAPSVLLSPPGPLRADPGGNVTLGCHVKGDPEPELTWLFNGRAIGSPNATSPDQSLVIEVEEGLLEKWTNLSVWNVSEADAGEYSCVARNSVGTVVRNVSLVLAEVVTASTVSAAEPWLLWLGVAGGGATAALAIMGAALAACCACGSRRRRHRHPHRVAKHQLKGSVSFSDQEKKLLDVSITTTTERETSAGGEPSRGSCEMLQSDMELMEQSPSIELCEPPVHITIESHQSHLMHSRAHSHAPHLDQAALPVTVFPPPPPEFSSSVLPPAAFGNIFISVSVSQDAAGGLDVTRYPDLLDVTRGHVATLPRRRVVLPPVQQPPLPVVYDNMGPRVTAAGSSTLSLPDAVGPQDEPQDGIPPPPPPPHCTPHTGERRKHVCETFCGSTSNMGRHKMAEYRYQIPHCKI